MTQSSKDTLTTILHDALVALSLHNADLAKAKILEAVGFVNSRPTIKEEYVPSR